MNWKKNSKSLENQEAGKGNVDTEERREIAVLEADPGCGLGAEEVRLRVENGYVNRSDSSPTKSVGDIIKSNTFTFFNLVFVVLGGCLIAVGSYTNLLFLVIAAANTFIGIFRRSVPKGLWTGSRFWRSRKYIVSGTGNGRKFLLQSWCGTILWNLITGARFVRMP